jgi:hypothetical protein
MMPSISYLLTVLSVTAVALAKTDLSGCTSSQTVVDGGASLIWYVPGTGEICAFLDCGGGRDAPITTVPGCAAYSGTATYSPSYLSGWGSATATLPASSVWASSSWTSSASSPTKAILSSETATSTLAAPVITSSASLSHQVYGTAATLSTFANGTLSATATPSATSSSALSNDGVTQTGSSMLVIVGVALAGLALW